MNKIITIILLITFSFSSFAHSGGTDEYRCHAGSKPYHCHGDINVNIALELNILSMYKGTINKHVVIILLNVIKNSFQDKDLTDALRLFNDVIKSGKGHLEAFKQVFKNEETK